MEGIRTSIRNAEPGDAAVITDFNLRLAKETEDLELDPQVAGEGVRALLADASKGLYFVAESDGRVVGQVMITYEWSDWRNGNIWWLQSVYVLPEFRRQGIFRDLFQYVVARSKAEPGVWGLRLYMHAENAAARATYERLGMTATAYQVFELGTSESGGT